MLIRFACIMIAIFPQIASAEKIWGHDVWIAQCVPARGDSYWIGVSRR
jgi:hypothetical protein